MAERLRGHPSPYLEQHADNPVDWWPWCDEAFVEARWRDVPVFLSIGYATCHWCHVMAHESFEDEAVAAAMNEAFVCIKVDREERPDIDGVYMAACQTSTGSGGWPLTVLLDHEKRPWFVGTYFPRIGRGGRIGMTELVPRLAAAWNEQRSELEHSAKHLVDHLQMGRHDAAELDEDAIGRAVAALSDRFDAEHGGFGTAPKFPSPHTLRLLLAHGGAAGQAIVTTTLDAMIAGGIHDHVGGGFHRYSTDRHWLVPHFEKMLYDQATMLQILTEAWQVTGESRYEAAARGTVGYVQRDLAIGPAFASAEDADSEGEEGTFYVWTGDEIQDVLGDDASTFAAVFGVRPDGNFHDEATGKPMPSSILHAAPGTDTAGWATQLQALRRRREGRPRPLRDDKVLTDWNGLWTTSLARAAMTFGEPAWLDAAVATGAFLRDTMLDGRLRHRWRDGVRDDDAFLDDHAAAGLAWVTLFEATGDVAWLQPAQQVAIALLDRFGVDGAFATSAADGEALPARQVDAYDGAMPSGNALAIELLDRLGRLTDNAQWADAAHACIAALARQVNAHPSAYTALLLAADATRHGREVVVTGADEALWQAAWTIHGPDAVRIRRSTDSGIAWIDAHAADRVAAYVCRDHACQAPVDTVEALRDALA